MYLRSLHDPLVSGLQMFTPTDCQTEIFDASFQLAESARKRLAKTWAAPFLRNIMPILLEAEKDFKDLYPSETGRGCWSIARKLGLCLLQELQDLTDEQTINALCFDARWQHALMLRPEESYLSRISLWDFRSRLIEVDPEMTRLGDLVRRIATEAIDDLDLDISVQRCDSTHITSNIAVKGRGHLFRKTLRYFDAWLQKQWPEEREKLSHELLEWLDSNVETWFGRLCKKEYQARLEQMAQWMLEIVETFGEHEEISSHERFELIVRLLDEHCVIESDETDPHDDGSSSDSSQEPGSKTGSQKPISGTDKQEMTAKNSSTATLRKPPKRGSRGLQSPYDPDAGYTTHKGTGYSLHIVETCENENKTEIIVHHEVRPAETDCGRMSPILQRLRTSGLTPKTMLADAGYGTGGEVLKARVRGTELLAPIPRGNQPLDRFGRERFDIDEQTGEVLRCPADKKPFRHGMRRSASRRKGKAFHAYFHSSDCETCPFLEQCPTHKADNGSGAYQLELRSTQRARDQRLAEQQTDEFWDAYKMRSGVEATVSELKRAHGVGDLRVRGLPKVRMKAALKVCACNVKRWGRAALAAVLLTTDSQPSGLVATAGA